MKKIIAILLAVILCLGLAACKGKSGNETETGSDAANTADESHKKDSVLGDTDAKTTFKIGICNYVDDASLNQIVANIKSQLDTVGKDKNVAFKILEDNCMADSNVLEQIIANFIAENVDLMVGVATPVAVAMQAKTEDNHIPVVFAAVSDPESAKLVESNDHPGANITGTSDYLDTNAIMNLIFAQNPDVKKIGLLYDVGQDSSETPIAAAKEYLEAKGVEIVEKTGTNDDEVALAADALIAAGVDAVFTPTDNTIMKAQLSIYEKFIDAGVLHYTGADSFALNGAFLGYGVDYANLGVETANMVAKILIDGADPATTAVMKFDNGTATVNTDVCEALGLDYSELKNTFAPFCTKVQSIKTAEDFE